MLCVIKVWEYIVTVGSPQIKFVEIEMVMFWLEKDCI